MTLALVQLSSFVETYLDTSFRKAWVQNSVIVTHVDTQERNLREAFDSALSPEESLDIG